MAEKQQEDVVRMVVQLDEQDIEAKAAQAQDKINQRLEEKTDGGRKTTPSGPAGTQGLMQIGRAVERLNEIQKALGIGRIGGNLLGGMRTAGRLFGLPLGGGAGGAGGGGGLIPPGAGGGGGLSPAAAGTLRFAGAIGVAILALKAFSGFMNNKVNELGKLNPKTAMQQSLYEREQAMYERKKAKAWEGAMTEWVQAKRDLFKSTEGIRLWMNHATSTVFKTLIRGGRGLFDPSLWVQPINQDARSSLASGNPNAAFANGMRIDTGRFGPPVVAPGTGGAPNRTPWQNPPPAMPSGGSAAPTGASSGPQYQMPVPQIPRLENNIKYDGQFNIGHEAAVMNAIESFRSWILRGLNTVRDETHMMADLIDGRNAANLF